MHPVVQTLTTDKVDLPHPKTAGGRVQGLASVVLCQIMGVKTFVSPSEDVFRASAGSMGIEAFVKVRAALHAGTAALLWNSA